MSLLPTLDDCYPWQAGGCDWTIGFLWRWMSSFGRLDVIVLGIMLLYLFTVLIHVYSRYYVARHSRDIDSAQRRTLVAVLKAEARSLNSIALIAPYLGLVGTCEGILSGLVGAAMARQAFMVMIATRMAAALIPAAAGIPVAVLATCFYNYVRARIELLQGEAIDVGQERGFGGARRFPATKQFSELPAFGLLAVSALAFGIAGYVIIPPLQTGKGFYVELASSRCEDYDVVDRHIVLYVTEAGNLFLNQEQVEWSNLADRLSQIYSMRRDRTIFLLGDPGVPFQTIANVLDTLENASAPVSAQATDRKKSKLGILVRLVTPKAFNADCPKQLFVDKGQR